MFSGISASWAIGETLIAPGSEHTPNNPRAPPAAAAGAASTAFAPAPEAAAHHAAAGAPASLTNASFEQLLAALKAEHERLVLEARITATRICQHGGACIAAMEAAHALGNPLDMTVEADGFENSRSRISSTDLDGGFIPMGSQISVGSLEGAPPEQLSLSEHWMKLKGELVATHLWEDRVVKSHSQTAREMMESTRQGASRWLPCLDPHSSAFAVGLVFSPNSWHKLAWDTVGMALVMFDFVFIPFQAFDPGSNGFTTFMDWFTLLFWTCDMCINFNTAYYRGGELVVKRNTIAKHYFRTWFCLDMLVVGPDWLVTMAELAQVFGDASSSGGFADILRSRWLRVARALRALRLLRLVKLQRIVNTLYDMIDNEFSFIVAELAKLMVIILFLNHVIACGWWLMGSMAVDSDMISWINSGNDYRKDEISYQYATSLHWTLTQFTPASIEVSARNIIERLYSILVLLFAMMVFSSLIATVTSSMTIVRQMTNDRRKQFWRLRRYLAQRGVTPDLKTRIIKFLEHTQSLQDSRIQAKSVSILSWLSDQLKAQLAHELLAPTMLGHLMFKYLTAEMNSIAGRICHTALKELNFAPTDVLFNCDEEAFCTLVFKSGELVYLTKRGTELYPPLESKEWLSEAVLWSTWQHQGRCLASTPTMVVSIEPSAFARAVCIHPIPWSFAKHYAERFVTYMNEMGSDEWTDVLRDDEFYRSALDWASGSTTDELSPKTRSKSRRSSRRSRGSRQSSQSRGPNESMSASQLGVNIQSSGNNSSADPSVFRRFFPTESSSTVSDQAHSIPFGGDNLPPDRHAPSEISSGVGASSVGDGGSARQPMASFPGAPHAVAQRSRMRFAEATAEAAAILNGIEGASIGNEGISPVQGNGGSQCEVTVSVGGGPGATDSDGQDSARRAPFAL